ncbi:ATP-dependent metallopeptidase HflB [Bacteriovorax sp. BSW11_IV]|uniref:ATP-dependent zinc metalloprotease FtsH n=1 Tax=Bacteriovorax sp. BSW11_IV TaxID=1353529 RepID=UPI00038A1E12|nr:ATP-dependent zinc metalloprotease FtsH [Bacteriovorax sp. BSW11_IV]EQC43623.1 ATP-dependent metallopeptidase HflB [Bacteriovorax sp. BSW11_IV]
MKQQQKTVLMWIFLVLMMALVAKVATEKPQNIKAIKYPDFIQAVESKHVENVTFRGKNTIVGKFKDSYDNGSYFRLTGSTGDETFKILKDNSIFPEYEEDEKPGLFQSLLINWGPMIILLIIFFFFMRQIQSGGGKAMSFGKSKARMLTANDKKVTFTDVSGVEEAKEELAEVVDFLRDPKKYTSLGGKIPKGVILVGPPGTGKTLLARAVAGEANVPFFSISGSDFVEMFVGVGASRVRDLFEQGKKHAPCIIFIDEIDAVGRHRGHGMGGGHDEREQTLNQLLVEMDGFESNEGVILIAATNRIDVLDPALLRPGRFDRRVTVGPPDVRGRLGILKVHTRKTPLNEDVDLEVIAKGTPGFTGADLANLVNEAALMAARHNKKKLSNSDFEMAKDKVLMGPERKSMVISDAEKRITAYHEAGHTLVGMHLPQTDPIHKVSIMPRGGALGVTQTLPSEDRLNLTKEKGENLIAFIMGGRCAEEIVFDEITNGASNDIEKATQIAHHMVCSWGMSEKMGPRNYSNPGSNPFGGRQMESIGYSEKTAQEIDGEIHALIDNNYKLAKQILIDHRGALDRLAEGLIVWETLDHKQVQDLIDGKDIGVPLIDTDTVVNNNAEASDEKPQSKDDPAIA